MVTFAYVLIDSDSCCVLMDDILPEWLIDGFYPEKC